jgi:RNA polymerase sigma-70 factor (ECF subfamily)
MLDYLAGQHVMLRARQPDDVPVLNRELYNDVAARSRADTRRWRPIPPDPGLRLTGARAKRARSDEFCAGPASKLQTMAVTASRVLDERALLDAARAGDDAAFGRLVEEHRARVHAHCYRMLGSVHDADDAVQDTLLRGWRALSRFEARSSFGTWLYSIATNVCLDALADRTKRVLPSDYGPPTAAAALDFARPLAETVWVEPYPTETLDLPDGYAAPHARFEQREAVELAFIAALQHLPATQRAVLILREVLGFSAREVSEALDTSVASVNSALQRARRSLDERLPERSQQQTLRLLGDRRVAEIVAAFVDAWTRADVDALRALLAEDAVFSMPPWPIWWRGREALVAVAAGGVDTCPPSRVTLTRANAQPAIAYYARDAETGRYLAAAIDVVTLDGSAIVDITAFVTPRVFASFGLSLELPDESVAPVS